MYNELAEGLAYHSVLTFIEHFDEYTDYIKSEKEKNKFFKKSLAAFRLEQKKTYLTLYSLTLEKLARLYFFHNPETGEVLPSPRSDEDAEKLMRDWMTAFSDACVKYKVFSDAPTKIETYFANNPRLPAYGEADNILYTRITAYAQGELKNRTQAPEGWAALRKSIDANENITPETKAKLYRLGIYYLCRLEEIKRLSEPLTGDYAQDEKNPYILCQRGYLESAGVFLNGKARKNADALFDYISDAPPKEDKNAAFKAGHKHGYPRFRVGFDFNGEKSPCADLPEDDGYSMSYNNFYGFAVSGDRGGTFRQGKKFHKVDGVAIIQEKLISFADGWKEPDAALCAEWLKEKAAFFAEDREQAIGAVARFVTLLKLMYREWEACGKKPFLWYPAKYLILSEVLSEEDLAAEKILRENIKNFQ